MDEHHVVIVLVEDHEVVADWQKVVADRSSRNFRKKNGSFCFFSVCVYWPGLLLPIGKKVSKSASCGRWLL